MTTLLKRINNGVHVRNISKADLKSVGFDHEAISVDVREDPFIEVSDDVAEYLLKEDDGGWKEATAKEAERFAVKNAKADEDTAKADERPVGTAAATGPNTTGGSNTASGAGSSTP